MAKSRMTAKKAIVEVSRIIAVEKLTKGHAYPDKPGTLVELTHYQAYLLSPSGDITSAPYGVATTRKEAYENALMRFARSITGGKVSRVRYEKAR